MIADQFADLCLGDGGVHVRSSRRDEASHDAISLVHNEQVIAKV